MSNMTTLEDETAALRDEAESLKKVLQNVHHTFDTVFEKKNELTEKHGQLVRQISNLERRFDSYEHRTDYIATLETKNHDLLKEVSDLEKKVKGSEEKNEEYVRAIKHLQETHVKMLPDFEKFMLEDAVSAPEHQARLRNGMEMVTAIYNSLGIYTESKQPWGSMLKGPRG
ncbi:hypothetical protein F5B20DRAFT_560007 [Whalleya microplaca]|nr:hypothetical protein F5B20DRAFT_560007 [Whalleya microplaca]